MREIGWLEWRNNGAGIWTVSVGDGISKVLCDGAEMRRVEPNPNLKPMQYYLNGGMLTLICPRYDEARMFRVEVN